VTLILDASYAIALALEEGDLSDLSEVTDILANEGAVVPPLWRLEVANSLLMAVRRGRIGPPRAAEIFAELEVLRITDDVGFITAWRTTYALAERYALTVYDAAYLELAMRLGARLASRDRQLAQAARKQGLIVFGSRAG
jgi:predicted nucleic acid-binding protein